MADRRPLISESSDLSDTTAAETPALPSLGFSAHSHTLGYSPPQEVSPPTSPPRASRPGYSRLQSDATTVGRRTLSSETLHEVDEEDIADTFGRRTSGGLGIASSGSSTHTARRVSIQTIPRVIVGATHTPIKSPQSTPNTGDPLTGGFPGDSPGSTPDLRRERFSPRDEGGYQEFRRSALKKTRSAESSFGDDGDYQRFISNTDTERLRRGTPSIKSAYDGTYFIPSS
jgi:hypothetical protein